MWLNSPGTALPFNGEDRHTHTEGYQISHTDENPFIQWNGWGSALRAGWGACLHPKPRAKQSKAKAATQPVSDKLFLWYVVKKAPGHRFGEGWAGRPRQCLQGSVWLWSRGGDRPVCRFAGEYVSHRVALDAWRIRSPAGGGGVEHALPLIWSKQGCHSHNCCRIRSQPCPSLQVLWKIKGTSEKNVCLR